MSWTKTRAEDSPPAWLMKTVAGPVSDAEKVMSGTPPLSASQTWTSPPT
jgi:hypothetical protein